MPPRQAGNPPDEVEAFVSRLTSEERMLVVLKRELYDGSWDAMLADLHARLEGKPYVFRLANRIHEDIERIGRLKAFEQARQADLAEHVNLDTMSKP